jgi:hypothetical protein
LAQMIADLGTDVRRGRVSYFQTLSHKGFYASWQAGFGCDFGPIRPRLVAQT